MADSIVSNPNHDPPPEKPTATTTTTTASTKWPGWPGDNVYRLVVPVLKVGGIIGRRGELVRKIRDETRARIRVLDAPLGTPDRVVLISGKEDPDVALSPAMDAVLRVFKHVVDLSSIEADNISFAAGTAFCSIKLLVALAQALDLIGKQGSIIKSIQGSSGAAVRVSSVDELPLYASPDERIVEIHGEALKVLKALEAIIGHLRKFLVDHTVVAVIEKNFNATFSQDDAPDAWSYGNEPLEVIRPGPSVYLDDEAFSKLHPARLTRSAASIVTQITQTMQIPLPYAEGIIGIGGDNIAYIRRVSGASVTAQEARGLTDEITVEIRGTLSQVHKAQQLIQESLSSPRGPAPGVYVPYDNGLSPYSRYSETSYQDVSYPSPYSAHSPGGYEAFERRRHGYRF